MSYVFLGQIFVCQNLTPDFIRQNNVSRENSFTLFYADFTPNNFLLFYAKYQIMNVKSYKPETIDYIFSKKNYLQFYEIDSVLKLRKIIFRIVYESEL